MGQVVILSAVLVLVVVATLAQGPVYRWTDEQGEVHYTNDSKSIPPAARAEPTAGEDLNAIAADDEPTSVELPAPFEIHPDADVSPEQAFRALVDASAGRWPVYDVVAGLAA